MRNWTGVHNERTEIGDGLTMLTNVSLLVTGQIGRRPQLGERLTLSAHLMQQLRPRTGGNYMVAVNGSGSIVSANMDDGTTTTVATGLNSDIKGCLVSVQQLMYYTNDFNDVIRINNGVATAVTAGIESATAAPSVTQSQPVPLSLSLVTSAVSATVLSGTVTATAVGSLITIVSSSAASYIAAIDSVSSSGGSLNLQSVWPYASTATALGTIQAAQSDATSGVHLARYRYKDSATGFVSNPSPETSFTQSTTLQTIALAPSSDAKVDSIILEITTSGGTEFFQASVVDNSSSSVDFTLTDAQLAAGISASAYYGDFGHEPPPVAELLCEHRGRLFAYKTSVRTNTAVSVALSAASVSGTGFSTNWAGRLATFVGSSSVSYVISSVSANGTSLTLASNYAGSTSTAASMQVVSPTPDMLYWSRAGFPESWKPSTWARRVLNNGDAPTALFSAYDTLWVCGANTLRAFDYTGDPAAARITTVPTQLGVYNERCVVNAEGRVFCFGECGVFEIRGRVPTPISTPIDQEIENIIDRTQSEAFHATYDYFEDAVTFHFCRTGDTSAKDAVSYHLPSGEWQMRSWRQGLRCSTIARTSSLQARPYYGCENGYVWRVSDSLTGDGVSSAMTTGVVTVDSGATTTSIPVTESLPTGSDDLSGAMLYNPLTGTARAITSNTASTITCAAFSAAPADGASLYVGSIPVRIKSEWWCGPSPHAQKNPPYLMLEHVSDEDSPEINVGIYNDLSDTPVSLTKGSGDVQLSGVTYSNGDTSATVDLSQQSGVLYLNLDNRWVRYKRYDITQDKPEGVLKLMDAKFMIQGREQVVSKPHPT